MTAMTVSSPRHGIVRVPVSIDDGSDGLEDVHASEDSIGDLLHDST